MQKKVVVADYDFGDVSIEEEIVRHAGFDLVAAQCKSEDEVVSVARDASAVLCQYAPVGEKAIDAFSRCEVIARYGTGVDIVDVDAATKKQILVTNAPNDWCSDEVADHAVALLIAIARRLADYDRATHAGTWKWQSGQPIGRIRGQTLGLLSFGAISQGIAQRMRGFGVHTIAHDPYKSKEELADLGAEAVSFEALLRRSDFLVIQSPLTSETRGLFGEAELHKMKPSAILVNTARGPIVQDKALYRALKEHWIAGAGLDDIEEEPAKVRGWKPNNPLFTLDNALITPHAAYYSEESLRRVREFAANEVVRVLEGELPLSPVNGDRLRAAQVGSGRARHTAEAPI